MTNDDFLNLLQAEAAKSAGAVATDGGDWIIKGFIDVHSRIYTISVDAAIVSNYIKFALSCTFRQLTKRRFPMRCAALLIALAYA